MIKLSSEPTRGSMFAQKWIEATGCATKPRFTEQPNVTERNGSEPSHRQRPIGRVAVAGVSLLGCWFLTACAFGQEAAPTAPVAIPLAKVERLEVPDADAKSAEEMKPYTELIEHTEAKIELVPIPGGKFLMGSPASEAKRQEDEGPQHEVEIEPFWMGKYEMSWEAYEVWMFDLDVQRRELKKVEPNIRDAASDEYQKSQPTPPYTDMSFGWGKKGFPAICMTQLAARTYCNWLSMKTGRYYRLPTEAEWEYACRANTTTAYSFGDDPAEIDQYGWYYDNSEERYNKIGQKKPNPWGLHDMHGNVAEWTLDQYIPDFYQQFAGKVTKNPLAIPTTEYPRVVRGGSWYDDAEALRSAARKGSSLEWKKQDPQIPQSMWYFTDATFVGFRVVRPLVEPSEEEKQKIWDNDQPVFNRKAGRR